MFPTAQPEKTAPLPDKDALPRLPVLDARLQAVAAAVPPGARVADVGCDHGKLAVFLAAGGRASSVLAMDIRPQPLARARRLAADTGCGELVECRLADGLCGVVPGEVDTVVLAGLSGITAAQILAAAPWTRGPGVTVLAVPANKPEALRRFFAENGYTLQQEEPVLAAGRPYVVMTAAGGGSPFAPDEPWCWLGRLPGQQGAAARACRGEVLRRLQKRAAGLTQSAAPDPAALKEVRQLIKEVEPLCR